MSLLHPSDDGARIVQASWAGTVVFTAVSVAAVLSDAQPVRAVAVVVSLVLFAAGCGAFLWSYWGAVQRSRTEEIGIGGLYFAAGDVAPKAVSRSLNLSLAVETVVAVAAASLQPFTTVAFGILVPVYAMGLTGVWVARFGQFGPRVRRDATPGDQPAGARPGEEPGDGAVEAGDEGAGGDGAGDEGASGEGPGDEGAVGDSPPAPAAGDEPRDAGGRARGADYGHG